MSDGKAGKGRGQASRQAGEGVENGGGMGDEGVLRLLGISMGEGRG